MMKGPDRVPQRKKPKARKKWDRHPGQQVIPTKKPYNRSKIKRELEKVEEDDE
jgi:hypothetical protein